MEEKVSEMAARQVEAEQQMREMRESLEGLKQLLSQARQVEKNQKEPDGEWASEEVLPLHFLPDTDGNPFPGPTNLAGPALFDPPNSQFSRLGARDQYEARVLHSSLHSFFRCLQDMRQLPAIMRQQPQLAETSLTAVFGQLDRTCGLLATRLAALYHAADHGMAEAAAVYESVARATVSSVSPQFAEAATQFEGLRLQERFKAAAKSGKRGAYGDFTAQRGRGGRGGGSSGGQPTRPGSSSGRGGGGGGGRGGHGGGYSSSSSSGAGNPTSA